MIKYLAICLCFSLASCQAPEKNIVSEPYVKKEVPVQKKVYRKLNKEEEKVLGKLETIRRKVKNLEIKNDPEIRD